MSNARMELAAAEVKSAYINGKRMATGCCEWLTTRFDSLSKQPKARATARGVSYALVVIGVTEVIVNLSPDASWAKGLRTFGFVCASVVGFVGGYAHYRNLKNESLIALKSGQSQTNYSSTDDLERRVERLEQDVDDLKSESKVANDVDLENGISEPVPLLSPVPRRELSLTFFGINSSHNNVVPTGSRNTVPETAPLLSK